MIDGFHAASGQMPQDVMHVLFEGVLHLEIHLMLKCFISEERLFSQDFLNSRIESFAYGRTDSRCKLQNQYYYHILVEVGNYP